MVRDTLTATFVGFGAVSAAALAVTGTRGALPEAGWVAALVPLTALGHVAGRPVFARLSAGRSYERVLVAVLLAAVGGGLATVLL